MSSSSLAHPTAPIAAIDVGTNTTRLLVARVAGGVLQPIATGEVMTGLGAGLDRTGRLTPDGIAHTAETVRAMCREARQLGADRIVLCCTAPGREAANADDLLEALRAASGVEPRVLTGVDEARLTFRGLVHRGLPSPLVACDLGGGSLEVMGGSDGRVQWATSLPLGTRRLTERFSPRDPPALDLVEPMIAATRALLDPVAATQPAVAALAAGGSPVALARLAESHHLDNDAILAVLERLAAAPAEDVAEESGLDPARVRLCLAGAAVVEAIRRAFGLTHVTVSETGLREGLVLEAVG